MSAKVTLNDNVQERRTRIRTLLKEQGMNRKNIRRMLPGLVKNKDSFRKALKQAFDASVSTCGVYSFAGDPRCILMWSHYANNHEGLCFQFERARDVKCLAGAMPVTYSDDYPEADWVNSFSEDLSKVMLRKFTGWQYESESRIVQPNNAKSYLPFNPDALQGIILGCRVKEAIITKLQELLKERERAGYTSPRLYKAVMHDSKFCLVIKQYN